jgi:protein-disulfide isomerase
MCAGLQGKFWEMHDAIFQAQAQWTPLTSVDNAFGAMAARIGIDVPQWQGCVASHMMRPLIEADYQRAVSAGVNSTPSFFIGDRQLSGAMPVDSFRVAIDAALGKAAGSAPR